MRQLAEKQTPLETLEKAIAFLQTMLEHNAATQRGSWERQFYRISRKEHCYYRVNAPDRDSPEICLLLELRLIQYNECCSNPHIPDVSVRLLQSKEEEVNRIIDRYCATIGVSRPQQLKQEGEGK